jgi:hypothetical protein
LSLNGQSISGKWTTYDESIGEALEVIEIDFSVPKPGGK